MKGNVLVTFPLATGNVAAAKSTGLAATRKQ